MSNHYEVYTSNGVRGIPINVTWLTPSTTFALGNPAQTLGGMNGFITDVDKHRESGVLDIGSDQIYMSMVLVPLGDVVHIGTPVYFDIELGKLTTVGGGTTLFGKVCADSYKDTWPIVGTGDYIKLATLVSN